MTLRFPVLLDAAAKAIETAIETPVARNPETLLEPIETEGFQTVASLADGTTQETGFLLGATVPYEMEHRGRFELTVTGGADSIERAQMLRGLAIAAANAIKADPTLGGLCDFAELAAIEPETGEESEGKGFAAIAAALVLTYAAETALG